MYREPGVGGNGRAAGEAAAGRAGRDVQVAAVAVYVSENGAVLVTTVKTSVSVVLALATTFRFVTVHPNGVKMPFARPVYVLADTC